MRIRRVCRKSGATALLALAATGCLTVSPQEEVDLGRRYAVVVGQPRGLEALGIDVGANLFFAKHSRDDEAEADSLAIGLLVETGWHPEGLVTFFRTMLENRESRPNALESLFASHPLTGERIGDVERMIADLPPERLEGLRRDSRSYARLRAALESHPPPPEEFRIEEED